MWTIELLIFVRWWERLGGGITPLYSTYSIWFFSKYALLFSLRWLLSGLTWKWPKFFSYSRSTTSRLHHRFYTLRKWSRFANPVASNVTASHRWYSSLPENDNIVLFCRSIEDRFMNKIPSSRKISLKTGKRWKLMRFLWPDITSWNRNLKIQYCFCDFWKLIN